MLEGELIEVGATKDGEEVQATWTSSKPNWFDVVNGGIICLYGSSSSEIVADITASYNGETAVTKVKGWPNSMSSGTRFKIIEFNLGVNIISSLEFIDNGQTVAFNTLTIFVSDPETLEVDKSNGRFTMLRPGKAYVVCIYKGKKYAAVVTATTRQEEPLEIKEEKKTRKTKKKLEEGE